MDERAHQKRIAALRLALQNCGTGAGWQHRCSYLAEKTAWDQALRVESLDPGIYHALMDLNFRRSGTIVYRPQCIHCQQCRAIRVPVADFQPNRSQQRCWKRTQGLEVSMSAPELDQERHDLYRRYLRQRHDGAMDDSLEGLREFLYESPVQTQEVTFRRHGRLLAVGIVDVEPRALSTVYCYYDPEYPQESLGVVNILWTIAHARDVGVPYVYLGYYIRDCARMNYKLNYRPCELWRPDGTWERVVRGPQLDH